tara:strand:- start:526 stop:726 length:201 start_codon:yes stop_codon:yes gene_type:complete
MSEEQSLKEKLVEYANEYEYVVSISREHEALPDEGEVASKIQMVADKLGWTLEEAYDYADFINQRY